MTFNTKLMKGYCGSNGIMFDNRKILRILKDVCGINLMEIEGGCSQIKIKVTAEANKLIIEQESQDT